MINDSLSYAIRNGVAVLIAGTLNVGATDMSAKLRYHQRNGHIIVTWDHCRVGTITRNDDGTFDASTIRSKYHLPKVSMIEALKYYRKFNWRSFLDATEYVPAQVRYEPKQLKLSCDRWGYF